MDPTLLLGLIGIAGFFVALGLGFAIGRFGFVRSSRDTLALTVQRTQALLNEAEHDVAQARTEAVQQVQTEWDQKKSAFEQECAEIRRNLQRQRQKLDKRHDRQHKRHQKLSDRETLFQKALDAAESLKAHAKQLQKDARAHCEVAESLKQEMTERHREIETRTRDVDLLQKRLDGKQAKLDQLVNDHVRKLEDISGLSREAAKKRLHEQMVDEAKLEAAGMIKDIRDEAKLTANREARKVVLTAIQRTAAVQTVENTVAVVNLDSDDMKGRIIGREGRNIRAFEAATGTEVIVDDTPEAVLISGFDPVRRAIAKTALVQLIQDGRIHPARIEEIVAKVTDEINEEIIETGERTVIDLGLHGVHPELVRLVGRMRYRSSYGQNLLSHSIEVAKLCSLMASELNLDPHKARRAGLLHDIGKVVEGDLESPHAIVGMELCRKYKESDEVCNAVGAHHDEVEMTGPLSPIVQSADAISGARPGARREALESYIKRLEKLEEVAGSFDGVERVYAIQAGRELRVIVNHQLVSDALAEQLAGDISKKIETEMQYPGQIRVTVIREVRSVSYAK